MFVRKSGPLLETDTHSRDIYQKFIMENQEILEINNIMKVDPKPKENEVDLQKERIYASKYSEKYEEILIYYGDDRGNLRVLDVSDIIIYPTGEAMKKCLYYPEQKVSFIPKRKGYIIIDKIGESLVKMAMSQKLPEIHNYTHFLKDEKKVFREGSVTQPIDLVKYLIEPEIFIVAGGDKNTKVKFFDLKLEQ